MSYKKNSMPYDAEHMFRHACAFSDCARSCEIEPNDIKKRTESHIVAGIVNSAFACEIFIKTLLCIKGIKNGTHELYDLWEELRKEDKGTTELVEESIKNWFDSEEKNIFDRILKETSNTYYEWRYVYEGRNTQTQALFLRGFRNVLRNMCCQRLYKKSWKEYIGGEVR